MDRLVHNSIRLELTGPTMRKKQEESLQTEATDK